METDDERNEPTDPESEACFDALRARMRVTAAAVQVWIAALEEGYATGPACAAWAERELRAASPVPPWLVDLTYAAEAREALPPLHAGARALAASVAEIGPYEHTSLRLGLMWIRHERGELKLAEALSRAGALTDARNYDAPSCEAFYTRLNEIEGQQPGDACGASATAAVRDLFAPHAALAREALRHLQVDA